MTVWTSLQTSLHRAAEAMPPLVVPERPLFDELPPEAVALDPFIPDDIPFVMPYESKLERDFFQSKPSAQSLARYYEDSLKYDTKLQPARFQRKETVLDHAAGKLQGLAKYVSDFFSRHPFYEVAGNHQLATVGFNVPVKAHLDPVLFSPFQSSVDNVRVHFYAVAPDKVVTDLGSTVTNSKGQATLWCRPDQVGTYRIFYRLGGESVATKHTSGTLTVLPTDKPILALDIDHLIEKQGYDDVVTYIRDYGGPYRLVALTFSDEMRQKFADSGAGIPIVVNDYHSSPFARTHSGFGETQLEKLKRLKFESGLPLVGVLSRPFKSNTYYPVAGIESIPFVSPNTLYEAQGTVLGDTLAANMCDYCEGVKDPKKYYWDGMMGSRAIAGNKLEIFDDNTKAGDEYLRLINGAQSFIFWSNFAVHDDEFGHKILTRLCERALFDGIKVYGAIDMVSMAPLPTDKGFSFLGQDMIDKMKDSGVQNVFHQIFQPPDHDMATRGLMTRLHRKGLIVDYKDANTPYQIVAHGGGRVLGSISYDEMRLNAKWYHKLLGLGRGSFRDLNVTYYGPFAAEFFKRRLEDYLDYGGVLERPVEDYLNVPTPFYEGGSTIRPVTHESFNNQSGNNALMYLSKDPSSHNPGFMNSFFPTPEEVEGWIQKSRSGESVTVYFSLFWWLPLKRAKLIPKLIKEGIRVKVVPYQMHTKLYWNDEFIDHGNVNVDISSLHDLEDLAMLGRDQPHAKLYEDYLAKIDADAEDLSEMFGKDSDPDFIVQYVNHIVNTLPITHERFSHHGLGAALMQAGKFLKMTAESGGIAALRGIWHLGFGV